MAINNPSSMGNEEMGGGPPMGGPQAGAPPMGGPQAGSPPMGPPATDDPGNPAMRKPNELEMNNPKDPDMMKGDIDKQFDDVSRYNERTTASEEKMKERIGQFKKDTMKKIFQMIKDLGYDPSNIESMAEFVQDLERMSPDLLQLFEIIMDAMEGKSGATEDGAVPEPEGPALMDEQAGPINDLMGRGNIQVPGGLGEEPGGMEPVVGEGLPPMGANGPSMGTNIPPMGAGKIPEIPRQI